MEVFKFNAAQHPDEKFYTYVGLARDYAQIALRNVPEEQQPKPADLRKGSGNLKK